MDPDKEMYRVFFAEAITPDFSGSIAECRAYVRNSYPNYAKHLYIRNHLDQAVVI